MAPSAPILLALWSAPAVQAAEVTRFPPALRGDVEVLYDVGGETGRLLEDGTEVGRRRLTHHTITYTGVFSPYKGTAVYVQLPHLASERVRFFDASSMAYDPRLDNGTMLGTPSLPNEEAERGSGLGGTWIGLRGAPMHRDLFSSRSDRVSWVLDAGFRFRDKTNFWTYGPGGVRGSGPGAPAFRFVGSVSSQHRMAQPYLRATLLRSGRITTDVVDDSGQTIAEGIDLRPASSADALVGVEYTVAEYGYDAMVALDLHGGFSYQSWQDVPSGLYLPSVLDASVQTPVTMSERTSVRAGGGVHWRFIEVLQLNVDGDVGVHSGGRIEHVYPVELGVGAVEWSVRTTLQFKVRDMLWEGLPAAEPERDDRAPKPMPESPPPRN